MNKIAVLGINYKKCSTEMREMVAVGKIQLPIHLKAIKSMVKEVVLLSTCNRTEIYVALNGDEMAIKERLISLWNGKADALADNFYFYQGLDMVRHLFRVACGLNSMVTGESEILGQIRNAYQIAIEEEATGKTLSRLFHSSFRVGKKVRRETKIGNGLSSTSSVACKLAEDILGNLSTKKIMLIGLGKIGEVMMGYLRKKGVTNLVVINRTHEKADEMAKRFGVSAIRFEKRLDEMVKADLVLTSSSAPHHLIEKKDIEEVMGKRGLPLLLIDLGLPRNIDPEAGVVPGVRLYNLDHLEKVVTDNLLMRKNDGQKADDMIECEVERLSYAIGRYGW